MKIFVEEKKDIEHIPEFHIKWTYDIQCYNFLFRNYYLLSWDTNPQVSLSAWWCINLLVSLFTFNFAVTMVNMLNSRILLLLFLSLMA
jgi:hypothetical protein